MPEHKIGTREEWQAARDELAKLEADASSSCSYAAVALARSLFRRGADFTAPAALPLDLPFTNASAGVGAGVDAGSIALVGFRIGSFRPGRSRIESFPAGRSPTRTGWMGGV